MDWAKKAAGRLNRVPVLLPAIFPGRHRVGFIIRTLIRTLGTYTPFVTIKRLIFAAAVGAEKIRNANKRAFGFHD